MRKLGKILLSVACLAGFIGLATVISGGAREPLHHGRPVSQWLMIYYESDRPNSDRNQGPVAAAAIRAIGTNALPCLLDWIRFETPSWHPPLARVLSRRIGNSRPARATIYRSYHRAQAAHLGFRLLGTNAVSAIPELSSMALDTSHPETAKRATELINRLGPAAFPSEE